MRGWVALLFLTACGPAPEVSRVQLTLALEFGADALLEVYAASGAGCGALEAAVAVEEVAEVHGVDRRAANSLNGGARTEVGFDALPAEVELAFLARAVEGGQVLASACQSGVVIPVGGEAQIELTLAEN